MALSIPPILGLYEPPCRSVPASPSSKAISGGEGWPLGPLDEIQGLGKLTNNVTRPARGRDPMNSEERSYQQSSQPPRQLQAPQNNHPRTPQRLSYTPPHYYTPNVNPQSLREQYRQPTPDAYSVPYSAGQSPPGGVLYPQRVPYMAQYTTSTH